LAAERVVIVGTTRWGTTLGILLASQGHEVTLLARNEEEAASLKRSRAHPAFGVAFPSTLSATADTGAIREASVCCLAVPAQTVRQNARHLRADLGDATLVLNASKGIEIQSGLRMSEVLAEELAIASDRYAVLSGPTLAREVAVGLPSAAVVGARDPDVAEQLQRLFMGPTLRIYTTLDVIGVELGGALKNVIAVAAAMSDALGYGANGRAALITRGLAEIVRLGTALGAEPLTFSGLAGIGDLIVTCTSPLSRNYQVGYRMGQGASLDQALADADGVAEGVPTTKAALQLAARAGVEMPIAEQLARVLFEGMPVQDGVEALIQRAPKAELAR
jgi:glycerol-3-phosphate dehydrogenase (NAD(P)+)